jgi:hypothetical protein
MPEALWKLSLRGLFCIRQYFICKKQGRLVQMSELSQLERTYSFILKCLVETGQAPFYTEIAADLGVSVEEGRKALQALLGLGTAAWVFPNTDYIVSFSPFNNLPTQYKITIEGQQKWFGQ